MNKKLKMCILKIFEIQFCKFHVIKKVSFFALGLVSGYRYDVKGTLTCDGSQKTNEAYLQLQVANGPYRTILGRGMVNWDGSFEFGGFEISKGPMDLELRVYQNCGNTNNVITYN